MTGRNVDQQVLEVAKRNRAQSGLRSRQYANCAGSPVLVRRCAMPPLMN
jgi:hypothetical protein